MDSFSGSTCYEYGLKAPPFTTSWTDFAEIIRQWFDVEATARIRPDGLDDTIREFPDPLLRHCLELLQLYNGAKHAWTPAHIDERLAMLEETDLTAAAYEYFHRHDPVALQRIPQPAIAHFWEDFVGKPHVSEFVSGDQIRHAIIQLHARKSAAYGSSWKRRGEQIGVMANIARKVDRLELVVGGVTTTVDETLFDTVVDLLVYCIKYQTYLADIDDRAAFRLFGSEDLPVPRPYSDGVEAFNYLVMRMDFHHLTEVSRSPKEVLHDVVGSFQVLEECFTTEYGLPPVILRLDRLQQLTTMSFELLAATTHWSPELCRHFLMSHTAGQVQYESE